MANPFLMDDEDPLEGRDPTPNPFLFGDSEPSDEPDNPFLASVPTANGARNPFAMFGEADGEANTGMPLAPPATGVGDVFGSIVTSGTDLFLSDPVILQTNGSSVPQAQDASSANFFHTTINEEDDLIIPKPSLHLHLGAHNNTARMGGDALLGALYSSEDELRGGASIAPHKPPPPRPIPPSHATQQLISSIADQLDQTTTNLLQKIPVTRTPSPVSMRDLHSPSPTPDFGDLMTSTAAVATAPDNPFASEPAPSGPTMTPGGQHSEQSIQKPPRPRPPPPRPAPPARSSLASTPVGATQPPAPPAPPAYQDPDLFDLFGSDPRPIASPKPPAPKTKEDILSLFSMPAQPVAAATTPEPKKPDLLSDDLDDLLRGGDGTTDTAPDAAPEAAFVPYLSEQPQRPVPPVPHTVAAAPTATATTAVTKILQEQPPPEQAIALDAELMMEPSPEIVFEVAPASEPESDAMRSEVSSEYSPTGSNLTSGNIPSSVSGSIVNLPLGAVATSDELESETTVTATATAVLETTGTEYVEPVVAANPFEMETDSGPAVSGVCGGLAYATELFGGTTNVTNNNTMEVEPLEVGAGAEAPAATACAVSAEQDAFDSFAAKFESRSQPSGPGGTAPGQPIIPSVGNIFLQDDGGVSGADAWGTDGIGGGDGGGADGFGNDDGFDDMFLSMQAPPKAEHDSDEDREFSVVIRPKNGLEVGFSAPALAPPPKSPLTASIYSGDSSPRVNPFDRPDDEDEGEGEAIPVSMPDKPQLERTDSQETPPTPLFDEDVSQPLEDFPRVSHHGDGWEMQLRQPNKKKITGQRFWKKIYVRLVCQGDSPVLQLYNAANDKEPFQELPLQACYSVSEIGAQQFDNFGKIFTVKLQYVFYKERPGVRPGQVTKAERLTNKLSQFAAYAIQGDYQGVKELGSDLKKLGLPVEHAPQVSQLFKLGSMNYEDMKQFSVCIEEALFKMNVHRDRALTYKTEEVQVTAVDELYVEQDAEGHVLKQIARVRLFFLAFLTGMPDIELGVNDLWRQGKEVVGRHDIIPVVTEEWIRLEGVEFHNCVQQDEYERSRTIKFKPPDACYIELMRFRIRPPKNRELPLQLKATWCVTGNKVELRADVLVPGFASRKLGQIPCEDVSIRFPIPECWIYLFRVEKHFRYGSVKSAHRRTGKIKGIERILGAVDTLQESLIEVTSGQAKYEHHHRAIVWRCPRLPKEGQGAYTTHQLVCRMALTSFDQIPDQLAPYAYIEFTMPATQASHTTVRSVSVQDSESDEPPEKYVRYLARHEYRVGIEHTTGESMNPYLAATTVAKQPPPIQEEQPMATTPIAPSDSDSDSN
ncbi:protein stoned-B [Anopheles aquasalis]|uniref:protein stoned-B n=1 Tax=Anopheles aquasalis TaxID=42839 RepID=UPI00215AFBC4|nr:protein stoned-B [Anopheles aquasalis]